MNWRLPDEAIGTWQRQWLKHESASIKKISMKFWIRFKNIDYQKTLQQGQQQPQPNLVFAKLLRIKLLDEKWMPSPDLVNVAVCW